MDLRYMYHDMDLRSPTHIPLRVPGWRHLSSSSSLSSTTTVSSFRPKWYEWALDSNDDHPPTWIAPLHILEFWLTSLPAAWEFSQFKMVHLEMNQESSLCQESCPWTPCVMFLGPSWTWIYLGRISCSKKYLSSWTFLRTHIDIILIYLVWGRWFTLSHYRWSIVGAWSSFFQSLLSLK